MSAIYHHRAWIHEIDPGVLYTHYHELLKTSGFTILGFQEYHFSPHGYTGLRLLGESHLAIHTFPEDGVTYRELSSCNLATYQTFLDADSYSQDIGGKCGTFSSSRKPHS